MRLAGQLNNQHDAATLVDYLLTLGIHAKPERSGDAWELWILDEDRVAEAKQELKAFQFQPEDEKYRAAAKEADRLRREQVDKALEARRNVIRLPRSRGAAGSGPRPATMILLVASAAVFVLSDFGQKFDKFGAQAGVVEKLRIASVREIPNGYIEYAPDLQDIRDGEFWRLFSPMFLHRDFIHFLFNMYWIVVFGSDIESRRGTLVFALLVAFSSVVCNLAQYWWDGPTFGGMSGVNYGLFGYILLKSRLQPRLGFVLLPSTTFVLIAWLFLCMTGAVGSVANAGHVGGFVAGLIFAGVPVLLRRGR